MTRTPFFALLFAGASACASSKPCPCAAARPASQPVAETQCPSTEQAQFAQKPIVVWDGDSVGTKAKGWAHCQETDQCSTAVDAKPGAGRQNSVGVEFTAKGKQWIGFGWNWFGWWPDTSGTDISKHKSLSFWMKVTAEPGKLKPEPQSLTISLHGSSRGGKDTTESVPVNDFAPGFLDGEWHEIVVPMEPLLRGKGESFDTEKAWELDVGSWNPDQREYALQLDEIGFR